MTEVPCPPPATLPEPRHESRRNVRIDGEITVADLESEMTSDQSHFEILSLPPVRMVAEDVFHDSRPADVACAAGEPRSVVASQHRHVVLDPLHDLDEPLAP